MVKISRRGTLKLGATAIGSLGIGLTVIQTETEGSITVEQMNIESSTDEVIINQESPSSVTVDINFLDIEYDNVTINGESGSFEFDINIEASGGNADFNQTVDEGLSVPVQSTSGTKRVDQIHNMTYDLVSEGMNLTLSEGESVDLNVVVEVSITTNNLDVVGQSTTSSDSSTITITRQNSGSSS